MNISNLIMIIFLFYVVLLAVVYLSQRSLLYHPEGDLQSPVYYGLGEMEPFSTKHPEQLTHWYGKGRSETSPVIVLFHGNAGHLGYRAFKARILLDQGYGVLLVGYRGYGDNPGSPSEEGLYADARSALGALAAKGVSAEKIILYGESLGSGVAVQMAAEGYGGALILESSYSSMIDTAFHHYPIFPVSLLLKDRFASVDKVSGLTLPKLFIHGGKDQVIPLKFGYRLYEKASDPKLWKEIEMAGHNDVYEHGAAHIVLEFLGQTFQE